MPQFYQILLSETQGLDLSSIRFLSRFHSLDQDLEEETKDEVWVAIYESECLFSWRRAVCVLQKDGFRVVQRFAFSAPEYRAKDTNFEILNCKEFRLFYFRY
jgi:hypothetical protein